MGEGVSVSVWGEGVSVSDLCVRVCAYCHMSHVSFQKILVSAASYSSLGRDLNQRKSQEKRLLAHLVGWLQRLWIRCVCGGWGVGG